MKPVLCALMILSCAARAAAAQTPAVEVRAGDIYVHDGHGTSRLTHDDQAGEATFSGDRDLVAYVHKEPQGDHLEHNDIYLCSVKLHDCAAAVHGTESSDIKTNLSGINTIRFSLQAGEGTGGMLAGSLFFLSDAGGANTGSLHRLMLRGKTIHQLSNALVSFVTFANSIEVIPTGKYAGALRIEVQQYTPHGACGAMTIFDPNTRKVLQQGPANDC